MHCTTTKYSMDDDCEKSRAAHRTIIIPMIFAGIYNDRLASRDVDYE